LQKPFAENSLFYGSFLNRQFVGGEWEIKKEKGRERGEGRRC